MKKENSGFWALLSAAVILGTFGVWIRQLDIYYGEFGQVVMRSLAASLFIIAILGHKRIKPVVTKGHIKYLIGFSAVFPLSIVCFTYAATNMKVSNALFMLYVGSVAASYAWGRFAFKESFTRRKALSVLLLLIGLVIFVNPFSSGDTFSIAVILGVLSGVLEGSAHAFRKYLKKAKREVIVFYQSMSSVFVGTLLFVFSGQSFSKSWSLQGILVACLFGALLVAIGYLLAYGFGHYDVNVGTVVLACELFFALVINYFVLRESPSVNEVIGGLFIFAGAIANNLPIFKNTKK